VFLTHAHLVIYPSARASNQARDEEVPQSFGKYLIERQKELELSDDETAYLAGSMFGAGSDTTASAISVAVMASACYPEAAERVRKELDSAIGKERRMYIPLCQPFTGD